MKQIVVVYANCQADGLVHFLKKTSLGELFEFRVHHNWQLILGEQPVEGLINDVQHSETRYFIYQPTAAYKTKDGQEVPSTNDLKMLFRFPQIVECISFSYLFNHGFMPIVKLAEGLAGWMTGADLKRRIEILGHRPADQNLMFRDYNDKTLRYDCARRFTECLQEQARREEETDIKMAPWMLQNYKSYRLFLNHNHPSSYLFAALAYQVLKHFDEATLDDFGRVLEWTDINEASLPGTVPVSAAAVEELGLMYQALGDDVMFYRDQLEQMIKECGKTPQEGFGIR